jgi:hypothetical protein
MIRSSLFLVLAGLTVAAVPSFSHAQQRDPAQFREQMMNRIKERMGATDDEWKVLEPKIEKVTTAQRNSRGGFFGGGRRGGNNGNAANANPPADQSPVQKASADLRTALENKDTPADEIAKKLTALREAREKGKAEVAAAQKELKEVLTQRQEAVLVTMGMLD